MGSSARAADSPESAPRRGPTEPRGRHRRRLHECRTNLGHLEARERHLALSRLLIAIAGAVVAWAVLDPLRLAFGWVLLPLLLFGAAVLWHDRVIRRRQRAERRVAHHERCLRRLDGVWQGEGPDGRLYSDPDHPCAADLDLFGDGSLFQRLCTARTRPGQATVARWLKRPAPPDEVRLRQAGLRELGPRLELRERLALAGREAASVDRLRIAPLIPGASIQVVDSLQEGISGFYAEIRKLRALVDLAAQDGPPLLFLLDEIMARTNSHDRRVGAEAVLRSFLRRDAFGLVTTHDLALTRLAEDLGDVAANVHFVDHLEEGEIRFDYGLRPGVVQRSNAVELMRSIGLDV